MEYNLPSELIKQLDFGQTAKDKVIAGVTKLAQAVKSTLGASGKCVIYEDAPLKDDGSPNYAAVDRKANPGEPGEFLERPNTPPRNPRTKQ